MGDKDGAQQVLALDASRRQAALEREVGAPWEDEYGGPRGTPTVDGDLVYALGTEGDLVCLEAATGKERWRKNLPGDFGGHMMSMWKFSESPLVDGDRLVFTPGGPGAAMVALDKRTGKDIWQTEQSPTSARRARTAPPTRRSSISNAAGVKQYVQLMGRGLVGVRASDGKFLWGYNRVANDVANIPTPVVRGDFVFASTGYQTGAALLRAAEGRRRRRGQRGLLPALRARSRTTTAAWCWWATTSTPATATTRASPSASTSRPARWPGAATSATRAPARRRSLYADGRLYFRYQNGMVVLIEATPDGLQGEGLVHDPRRQRTRAGRTW